ncbi:hypothetical protein [Mailhella massiliensis]|uniref:Uncharacterized protein n=1 Tax=Mailhella massiliensis TaxID=1903261 RepID=A0A921AW43_9BACT|nr:hypothetical protein [Mailhella massiliensis]HJD97437.1 hypothetical protein [Mailhella massiliensis]
MKFKLTLKFVFISVFSTGARKPEGSLILKKELSLPAEPGDFFRAYDVPEIFENHTGFATADSGHRGIDLPPQGRLTMA